MSTQIFLIDTLGTATNWSHGTNDPKLDTSTSGWIEGPVSTTRGAGKSALSASTVNGATNGVEIFAGYPVQWVSPPLAADVTIAGQITFNLWAFESNGLANVAINMHVLKVDGATGALTTIIKTTRTTELGTSAGAANWNETPGAGVACKKGDRLLFRPFGDDAGTMATGYTFTFDYGLGSAGADGDSYVTFTETFSFITANPTGTTLFPTNTTSDVATAAVDRLAWTARGAGVQTDVTNTAAGWTAPIQVTDTAGTTVVDWWSETLDAVTLGGAVLVNARFAESNVAAKAAWRCEIAVCEADGSSPTVWAANSYPAQMTAAEAAYTFFVSGPDKVIAQGQRLRIRFYIDDYISEPLVTGYTVTLYYAGAAGATGDTYLTFTQTLVYAGPRYVGAAAGGNDTGGAWSYTATGLGGTAGNLLVLQVVQDGTGANTIGFSGITNCTALDGTATSMTLVTGSPFNVGSPTSAKQWLWIGRATGGGAPVVTGTNDGTDDIYFRMYEFSGVNAGSALSDVIENTTAGNATNGVGTSTSVTDTAVVTAGPHRLACNFIGVDDEVAASELTAMVGMTGGTWAYPVAAYGTSTGTDATLALVTADMPSAGTIDGASDAITSQGWGVVGFALIGTYVVIGYKHQQAVIFV